MANLQTKFVKLPSQTLRDGKFTCKFAISDFPQALRDDPLARRHQWPRWRLAFDEDDVARLVVPLAGLLFAAVAVRWIVIDIYRCL